MTKRSNLFLLFLAAGLTLATVACGGGSSSVTGPDAAAAAAVPPAAGATIVGTVQSGSTAAAGASSVSGLRVSVTGTSLQTTTDGSGRFALAGVPSGRAELRFEGPGIDARLEVEGLQSGQTLTVTVRVSGSSASKIEDGTEVGLRGRVDSVGSESLVVAGRTVRVDALTSLLDRKNAPVSLSAFKAGDFVETEGYPQADGSLLAKRVKLEDAGGDSPGVGQDVVLTGTISRVSPLVVAGRSVATDGATQYLGRKNETLTAADVLKAGNRVEVEGHEQADGGVLAKKIKLEN
jgi:hypothetical protein